ncbi:transcriptional regulator [Sphingobacterium mizutaii NBRC 14946 = DSM 11724]|nr:transcriptional regulator [Sphingobacterium mizutaii NBRC 14946 = DSM 11724]
MFMPYKEREINKLYYTMGEVTEMFGVNASQIRFYEREFDILQPKKNKKGNRLFTQNDIANLKIIFNLVKDKGYTLQGAREFLRSNKNEARENQRIIESLEGLKSFLIEVRDSL